MSLDIVSVDGYGINLTDLYFDNLGPGDLPQLINIALNRIIDNGFINDGLIGMIDDISGNHYEENHGVEIEAAILDGYYDRGRQYVYVSSVMPFEKSPQLNIADLDEMLTTALHDLFLKALQTPFDNDDRYEYQRYQYQQSDKEKFEKQFQESKDYFNFEEVHDVEGCA